MNRFFLAGLALACLCSPVLAAADPAFDPFRVFEHSLITLVAGSVMLAGVIALARHISGRGLALLIAIALVGIGMHPAFAAESAAVVAQPATDTAVVTVPYGTWLTSGASGIQEIVVSIVMAAIAFACRRLPAAIGTILKGVLTQHLVERAIAFGMNTVSGAVANKTLSVEVGNTVLANALNYAVTHAPEWFIKWAGGATAIRDHIIALLPMEAEASLATSTPTAQGATTTDPVKLLG